MLWHQYMLGDIDQQFQFLKLHTHYTLLSMLPMLGQHLSGMYALQTLTSMSFTLWKHSRGTFQAQTVTRPFETAAVANVAADSPGLPLQCST